MRRGLRSLVCCLLVLASGACAPESPTAFVRGNVVLDTECVASSSAETLLASGVYDIAAGGPGGSEICDGPYSVALLVYNLLRAANDSDLGRAEPNYLKIHSAEVKLMNQQRQPLQFEADVPLPNPFLVTTGSSVINPAASSADPGTGIAFVEVIPYGYAPFLGQFVGGRILAEIQLFGTTTGDVDIDLQPFTYPIKICDGCLTVCDSDLAPENTNPEAKTREELTEGECDDNSGSDGRVCIDPDC